MRLAAPTQKSHPPRRRAGRAAVAGELEHAAEAVESRRALEGGPGGRTGRLDCRGGDGIAPSSDGAEVPAKFVGDEQV